MPNSTTRPAALVPLEVLEALATVSTIMPLPALLTLIMDTLVHLTGAGRGLLLLEEAGELRCVAARGLGREELTDPLVSFTVIGDVLKSRQPVLREDALVDPRYGMAESILGAGIRSVVCCPLVSPRGVATGVAYLDSLSPQSPFAEEHLHLLAFFATQAASAIENARLFEVTERQRQQLAELDGLRREFIQAVSHEFRTPLTAVQAALDLLPLSSPTDEAGRASLLNTARQGLGRAITVLNRLLRFVSDEMGELGKAEVYESLTLRNLVEEWMGVFDALAAKKDLTLENGVSPELFCWGVRRRVLRILGEVLGNAVQYTERGGVVVEGGLTVPHGQGAVPAVVLRDSRVFAYLRISDTGPGIPPDELPHVCEQFYQGSRSQQVGGGIGLGLNIALRDAEALGGTLLVESDGTSGTTVTLHLPMTPKRESAGVL